MNYSKYYIVNPAYYLRADVNRVIITNITYKDKNPKDRDSFTSFIHPVQALILLFFDGRKNLKDSIDYISMKMSLGKQEVEYFVSPLIENNQEVSCNCYGNITSFPERTLIEKGNKKARTYNFKDFIIDHKLFDNANNRLNIPMDIHFVSTLDCLTDCIYCYANRKYSYDPMPTSRILEIIEEAHLLKMRNFDLTGGEFFLHKDWRVIYRKIKEYDLETLISTKMPISEDVIKDCYDMGLRSLQLSIDTTNTVLLSKMLRVNGNYWNKMRKTICLLEKYGISITVNSIITSLNISIENMDTLLKELFVFDNIKEIRFGVAGYSIYKTKEQNKAFIPKIEKIDILQGHFNSIASNCKKKITFSGLNLKKDKFRIDYDNYINRANCTGNQLSLFMLPDGKATYCEETYWHPQFILGDFKKQGIMEIWNSSRAKDLFQTRIERIRDISPCSKCAEFNYCHGTPGVCFKEIMGCYGVNNWDYPDPRCKFAPEPYNEYYIE